MEADVAEERETIWSGRKPKDGNSQTSAWIKRKRRSRGQMLSRTRLLLEPVRIQDNDAEFQLGDVETVKEPVEAAVVVSKAATTLARSRICLPQPKIRAARRVLLRRGN